MTKKKKVFVGLSGGVDSSVSAALLIEQGYDVIGIFIKVWQPDFLECTWKQERLDAIRVATHLGIPFVTLDLAKEYKKSVADYMIKAYKNGLTPNPDVMCNKTIKFGAFFEWARTRGADFVATGHYARNLFNKKNNLYELHASNDKEKDQSYFLWILNQKQLSHTLFPVGNYKKEQVRVLAKKFKLFTTDKKDSQGLCFVGKLDMKDFLKNFIPEQRGVVLNEQKEKIGYHDGASFYTIGQRHGFVIEKKSPKDKPFYIINKNIKTNTLIVSHKKSNHIAQEKKEIKISSINWISGIAPQEKEQFLVRVRYRQPLQSCVIQQPKEGSIVFDKPQIVASGQSIVFYQDSLCLGGGIIQ
ncbi:tRNA 2-thiouridine(34) synthase MnmA [Patescibacteria group bacterium]|nr:tRNA 2-thiouridine(34) synthase MnmA [Patescibacteria group bacterium]